MPRRRMAEWTPAGNPAPGERKIRDDRPADPAPRRAYLSAGGRAQPGAWEAGPSYARDPAVPNGPDNPPRHERPPRAVYGSDCPSRSPADGRIPRSGARALSYRP